MPVIGVENCPIQFETPAPSVTVPFSPSETLVPVAPRVKTIGEPANIEQESPMLTKALQFVFSDPGPRLRTVYRIGACEIPFPANWINGLLAASPAPSTIACPFANSTPSAGLKAPEFRQPGAPSTPDEQPANCRDVVCATSLFHGGPDGLAPVSGLKTMLLSVTVTVPVPDVVFNSPVTAAVAAVIKDNKTRADIAVVGGLEAFT